MTSKVDAAVISTVADILEKLQQGINAEYKKATPDSEAEKVLSALDDTFGNVVEELRDLIETEEEDDDL